MASLTPRDLNKLIDWYLNCANVKLEKEFTYAARYSRSVPMSDGCSPDSAASQNKPQRRVKHMGVAKRVKPKQLKAGQIKE